MPDLPPEPQPVDAAAPVARRFPPRRIAVAAGFTLVAIATAAVLIALALTQESPRWWVSIDAHDPAAVELARLVENGVTTALTKVRPDPAPPAPGEAALPAPSWKVFITTDQANAWLAARLRQWLADKSADGSAHFNWPPEVDQVAVMFEDGVIHIGARVLRRGPSGTVLSGEKPQTIAAAVRPELRPDGSLWFTAQSIQIGRLGVPASWVIGSAAKARRRVGEVSAELAGMPQTQRVLAALKGERPVVSRATMKLADGRRVRILAIEPADGRVVITCQTEQREVKAAK